MIKTRHFGEVEVDENKIINFKDGIPGFTDNKNYVLLTNEENQEKGPFFWLQSVDNGELAFAVVDPFAFYPTYSPEIKDDLVEHLGHKEANDLTVYNVLVIPDDIKDMTVNLRAPILINSNTKQGAQVVSDSQEYGIRHYIYQDVEKMKKAVGEGE